MTTIGILALQGAFREHGIMMRQLGCEVREIRKPEELKGIDGLVIPGGESTTIGKLMQDFQLTEPILSLADAGMPIFGTCAGLIMLAKEIEGSDQFRLGLMDITVRRNAFGRQRESFETDLNIEELGKEPFRAVFIRAPYILAVQPGVEVLASFNDKIVCARQGRYLVAAFHPELTTDTRLHSYFLDMVHNSGFLK